MIVAFNLALIVIGENSLAMTFGIGSQTRYWLPILALAWNTGFIYRQILIRQNLQHVGARRSDRRPD